MASWDWARIITVGGKQYAAKRTGSAFMELSREYPSDEQADADTPNVEIVRRWTAHIPHEGGRPALGTIIVECSKGIGLASGDGENPLMAMAISTDQGNTWTANREESMGEQGEYAKRVVYHRNGRGQRPQTILRFRVNEPVKFAVEGVIWGETT